MTLNTVGGVTEYGKCLETGKRQNPLEPKPLRTGGHRMTLNTVGGVTENEKCLETGKRQNPLDAKPFRTGGTERPFRCLDVLNKSDFSRHNGAICGNSKSNISSTTNWNYFMFRHNYATGL